MKLNELRTCFVPDDGETIFEFCEALQKEFDECHPIIGGAIIGNYKGIYLEANKDTTAYSIVSVYDKAEDSIRKRTHKKQLVDIMKSYEEERRTRMLSKTDFDKGFVNDIIENAMQKKDRYVALYFGEGGTSVNVYPISEEEE